MLGLTLVEPDMSSKDKTSEISSRPRASTGLAVPTSRSGEQSFGLIMLEVAITANIQRLLGLAADSACSLSVQHLKTVTRSTTTTSQIRLQAASILSATLLSAASCLETLSPDLQSDVQRRILTLLKDQAEEIPDRHQTSVDIEIRLGALQTLLTILENFGHTLEACWPEIFEVVNSACGHGSQASRLDNERQPKGQISLVRMAFSSLNLTCSDYLSTFDASTAPLCIESLGRFSSQPFDINIALSSIGLIWNVMDASQNGQLEIQSDARERLWLQSLKELLALNQTPRNEIRMSAVQTTFRSLESHGSALSTASWDSVVTMVFLPLMSSLKNTNLEQDAETKQLDKDQVVELDELHALTLQSIASMVDTFGTHIVSTQSFSDLENDIALRVVSTFQQGGPKACNAALELCQRTCMLPRPDQGESESYKAFWTAITGLHQHLKTTTQPAHASRYHPTQENLVRLVDLLKAPVSSSDRSISLQQLETILEISRAAVVYGHCPTYPQDIDNPSPLQRSALELLKTPTFVRKDTIGLVLSCLAEYISLAFTAAFDYVDQSLPNSSASKTKKITYIGMAKSAMSELVTRIQEGIHLEDAVKNGTVDKLNRALALPIRLRLDCPSPNKYGKDQDLWKSALDTYVVLLEPEIKAWKTSAGQLDSKQHATFWDQILSIFRSVLTADDAYLGAFDNDEQRESEEAHDVRVIKALIDHVVPVLGHEHMASATTRQWVELLFHAGALHASRDGGSRELQGLETLSFARQTLPRETLRYMCLGALFDLASKHSIGEGVFFSMITRRAFNQLTNIPFLWGFHTLSKLTAHNLGGSQSWLCLF